MNSTANYRSVLILTLAATLTAGLILALMWASAGPAGAQDEKEPPAKPSKLRITTERGSLDVSLDWEDVESASRYRVRWRESGPGNKLNAGIEVDSSDAVITVSDYGDWVVRVQACDDNGCGEPNARKFRVEPAPEPTPTPTQIPTPEPPPKPEPIPTPAPEPTPTPTPAPDLRVVIEADPPDPVVGQRVGLSTTIYPHPARLRLSLVRMGSQRGRRRLGYRLDRRSYVLRLAERCDGYVPSHRVLRIGSIGHVRASGRHLERADA